MTIIKECRNQTLIAVQIYLKIIIYWHKTQGLVPNFVTASCAEPHSPYDPPFDLHNIKHHIIIPYPPWSNKLTFPPTLIPLKFRYQSVCLSSPNPRHTPRISQPLHFTVLSTSDQYKSQHSPLCTMS